MKDPNWFRKKWGTPEVPTDILFKKIEELEERITTLEQKYEGALIDIKRLEEENVETTNTLYEIMHSVDAVDARIDILAEHCGIAENE
jgi:septal ring factor EnvC (AmiA/AmiB activator)